MATEKHNAVVKKRAAKARAIVAQHYDAEDIETSAMDLLADIRHLCHVKQYDFQDLVRRAIEHEMCERLNIDHAGEIT